MCSALYSPGAPCRRFLDVALALLSFTRLACSLPVHAAYATVIQRQIDLLDEYDYIVVGGGTAGLTVADRLSEAGECALKAQAILHLSNWINDNAIDTVLVIEYGYLDSSDSITAVTTPDQQSAGRDEYPPATRSYNFTTVPQTELDGLPKSIRAGAVVGGSSATNGMLLDRGSAEDYEAWVLAAGEYGEDFAAEWGWENFLPSFRKSVTFHPPTEEMQENYNITYDVDAAYGGTTPIHASYRPFQWPTQRKWFLGIQVRTLADQRSSQSSCSMLSREYLVSNLPRRLQMVANTV